VVSYKADDAEWIVLFGDDGLPARIRTVDADGVWGDCNYDMILSDWREVDGVKFAFDLSFTLNGHEVQHIYIEDVVLNPVLGPDLFRIPNRRGDRREAEGTGAGQLPMDAAAGELGIVHRFRSARLRSAVVPGNIWTQVKPASGTSPVAAIIRWSSR